MVRHHRRGPARANAGADTSTDAAADAAAAGGIRLRGLLLLQHDNRHVRLLREHNHTVGLLLLEPRQLRGLRGRDLVRRFGGDALGADADARSTGEWWKWW